MMALAEHDSEGKHQNTDAGHGEGRQAPRPHEPRRITRRQMRILTVGGCLLLAGMAPEGTQLLAYEAAAFATDACLAPAFDGPGCAGQQSHPGDKRPTASAALIAPEAATGFDLDESVLLPGDEVTYWCGEPQCSPPRRVIVVAGPSA